MILKFEESKNKFIMQTSSLVIPVAVESPRVMTIGEIKAEFADKWILLANPERNLRTLEIEKGIPLMYGKDKRELCFYGKGKAVGYDKYTVFFTGQPTKSQSKMVGVWRKVG